MNWLDIIFLLIISYGLIHGLIRGLVLELSSLVSIVAGIIVARMYFAKLALQMEVWFDISLNYAKPISFVVILIAVAIALHLIALVLDKFIKIIALGWFNRLLGGLFGAIKCMIILSVFANIIYVFNVKESLISHNTIENSILFEPIKNTIPFLKPHFLSADDNSLFVSHSFFVPLRAQIY